MDEFNADYYSTVAQVIPTLFIAAIATRFVRDQKRTDHPAYLNLLLVAVVAIVVFGELFAIEALWDRENASDSVGQIITFAMLAPIFMIGVELLPAPAMAVMERMSKQSMNAVGILGALLFLGVIAVAVAGESGDEVLSWLLRGFLLVILVVFALQTRPRKQDAPDEPPGDA